MEKIPDNNITNSAGSNEKSILEKVVDSSKNLISQVTNNDESNNNGMEVLNAVVNSDTKATSSNKVLIQQQSNFNDSSSLTTSEAINGNLNFKSLETDDAPLLLTDNLTDKDISTTSTGNVNLIETALGNQDLHQYNLETEDGASFVKQFMNDEEGDSSEVLTKVETYRTMVHNKKTNSLTDTHLSNSNTDLKPDSSSQPYSFPIISYKPEPTHLILETDGKEVVDLLNSSTFTDSVYSLEDPSLLSNHSVIDELQEFYKIVEFKERTKPKPKDILQYLDSKDYLDDVYGFLEFIKLDKTKDLSDEHKLKALHRLVMLKQHMELSSEQAVN